MTTILLATEDGLAVVRRRNGAWQAQLALTDHSCQCVAVDPHRPQRAYCGTFDAGLWYSDDSGNSWQPVGAGIDSQKVMSVAVSPLLQPNAYGLLWAGTEPSTLYFSEDGGAHWQERPGLQDLPSKPTWRFPPRPWTHHVRWIEPDANVADRLFVGIELGGVMRSLDNGVTWEDRKPGSQHDCHTLHTHPEAPGYVYEAAGGGYAESHDGGDTWQGYDQGMDRHYVWGLAVDPGNPKTRVVSAARGAHQAHSNEDAVSSVYRRTAEDVWHESRDGLPQPQGTRIYVLAANPAEAGVFYAATGTQLYRSSDAGKSWEKLAIDWPGDFHSQGARKMVVTGA